jgi:hypothetical protein
MLIIFHFPIGKAMVGKACGGKDVRLYESQLLQEPSVDVDDVLTCDSSMLDIALASRHGGDINRDAVCGLLTKCLQDVSSAIFTSFCLFALWIGF